MPKNGVHGNPAALDAESEITLGVLSAVENDSAVTQRSLAQNLGIALGLTNAYLKRCIKKGYIKIRNAPANRYAYYLTPGGFAEKSRLTAKYLSSSFGFFRGARTQCAEIFSRCESRDWRTIALAGVGDLGEIALWTSRETTIAVAGFIDPTFDGSKFLGLPVVADQRSLEHINAIVVTDLTGPQATYDRLAAHFATERILWPSFLNISARTPDTEDA
jgi:DNA-binding MarR family transcriptional regulator